MNQPTIPAPADIERFYGDLHAAREASRDQAEQLLPHAEHQVETHRRLVATLRDLLATVEADLARWATTAGELRATVDPDQVRPGAALSGKALREIAIRVLEQSDRPQPIHYRDWQHLVELAGYTIGGANPEATFLTALHREPRAESIGGRSGLWKLTTTEEEIDA